LLRDGAEEAMFATNRRPIPRERVAIGERPRRAATEPDGGCDS
jgi:hypothetical protein